MKLQVLTIKIQVLIVYVFIATVLESLLTERGDDFDRKYGRKVWEKMCRTEIRVWRRGNQRK